MKGANSPPADMIHRWVSTLVVSSLRARHQGTPQLISQYQQAGRTVVLLQEQQHQDELVNRLLVLEQPWKAWVEHMSEEGNLVLDHSFGGSRRMDYWIDWVEGLQR